MTKRRQTSLVTLLGLAVVLAGSIGSIEAAGPFQPRSPRAQELTIPTFFECPGCTVFEIQREQVVRGIAHYSFKVNLDGSEYNTIRIHRVVRENRAWHPMRTRDAIMLQHGCCKDFVGMFLPGLYSSNVPRESGLAVFLAQNRVDVWGINQAWNLVPAETTDFEFMEEWGLQKQLEDLHLAMTIAKNTRGIRTGSEEKLHLLGYSEGSVFGYALLNYETQLPNKEQTVKTFISADMGIISDDPEYRQFWCDDLAWAESMMALGYHQYEIPFAFLGGLAKSDPDGESPLIPGFTNLQAALFYGTGALFGNMSIHYLAGTFDADGYPTGLQYMTTEAWLDFLETGAPYEPLIAAYDEDRLMCGQDDVPWDDHLSEITVPVFNWATAGGLGPYGEYMLELLGSKKTESLIVSTHPPEEILLDFGHIDLFAAYNAPELAWEPLLGWIHEHR